MILRYTDIFESGKAHRVKAEITTEHSASSYGMPVVVLEDGNLIDATSWTMLNYQIISITKKEAPMMEKWLGNLYNMLGITSLGRKGGSAKSPKKAAASRKNALLGGRPKGSGSLTPLQKQALDLKQSGMTIREIAQAMDRQPENIRQLVARAENKMKKEEER